MGLAMTRIICERCKTVTFTTDPPHLCKDLKERYARQKKAVDKISNIIAPYLLLETSEEVEEVALKIVKAISGLSDLGV